MNDPAHTWIETADRLEELAAAMRAAPWVAIDTEANSMFVYREQVCLLQVNAGGTLFLVDTLTLARAGASLAPLKEPLEDPTLITYLHGGEYDVGCMKRDYGINLGGIWDSQQAASLLGWERTGYGAAVEKLCGVTLDKAFTQYDWATRPLAPGALRYALDDVIHLPRVCEELRAAVHAADLDEEVAIANQAVMSTVWTGGFDPGGFWRIKGIRELSQQALPMLAALYAWRDRAADGANLPPGRMLNSEVLLALVRQTPTSFQQLKHVGVKAWFLAQHGESLIEAIKAARDTPTELPPRPRFREVLPIEEERETRLKDWRRGEAERRTQAEGRPVPLQVVLPAKALEYLKQHGADNLAAVPQLGAKRISKYGERIRTLCAG